MTAPCWLAAAIVCLAAPVATAQNATVSRSGQYWVMEATGTAKAPPELLHLLMKVEYESALAGNSAVAGEKQLKKFLTAVETLGVPDLKSRVVNNVITPAESSAGFVHTRTSCSICRRRDTPPKSWTRSWRGWRTSARAITPIA